MRASQGCGLRPLLPLVAVFVAGVLPAGAQTSLTLEEAMRRAQGDTPEARALASSIEEAEARVRRVRAGYWPRVDLSETVQRGNQPVFVFSSLLSQHRFTLANFALPALNHPAPVTNTQTALALEQSLFDGGVTRLGVQAARLDRDLATTARDTARQDLAYRAAQAFVRVLQLEATVRAVDAAVASADSDRERARARRDAGLVTDADVLAVDVHHADVRQRQIATAGELAVARLQLADAIGLPLTDVIALARPPARPAPGDGDALVRHAVGSHTLHRQAELQVQLATNAQQTARAALLPIVTGQAGWELNGRTLGAQQSSWMIGAQVRVNVFRGFADSAQLAEARHAYARATAERERVDRTIEIDVRAALAQLAAARARDDAGRLAQRQARESQRIIRDRYESGLVSVTDVLRAAEAVVEAESRAVGAEMDVILRTVALDRALGRL